MPDTVKDIVGNPTVKILVIAFILGGVYFEFREMKAHQDVLEHRLEKKIKVLNSLEVRIRNLENCK